MRKNTAIIFLNIFLILSACSSQKQSSDIVKVSYWEKWTGFEGEAMQRVVDAFNEKKIRNKKGKIIQVEMVTTSQLDRRFIVSVAGGNPPDVAGNWSPFVFMYADKGALLPLDDYLKSAGITREDYIPIYWDICEYRGKIWALPSTGMTLALHWNKRLFREAGLDPNRPPKTIKELDEYAEKLTKVKINSEEKPITFYEFKRKYPNYKELLSKCDIVQMGFLPSEPGWWPWFWGYWFGGKLYDEKNKKIIADLSENIAAYEWVQSYSKKYSVDKINEFSSGFGQFASPQNAFLSGKVAMVIQGVWMYNFIDKYAQGMEWGAAPFPSVDEKLKDVSFVEADVLVIPKGAKHPDEAFEFIRYVNSQEGMELLCDGQRKFSLLSKVSPEFYKNHKHPYIHVFRKLAESPNAFSVPKIPIWQEYQREMISAYDRIKNMRGSPEQILKEVREKIQQRLERETELLKLLGKI